MTLHHFSLSLRLSLSLSIVLPFGICSPATVCFFVCLFFLVPLCVFMHEFQPAEGHEKRATARRDNKPWETTRRKPEKKALGNTKKKRNQTKPKTNRRDKTSTQGQQSIKRQSGVCLWKTKHSWRGGRRLRAEDFQSSLMASQPSIISHHHSQIKWREAKMLHKLSTERHKIRGYTATSHHAAHYCRSAFPNCELQCSLLQKKRCCDGAHR